jgi:hypothetical protein
MRTTVDLPPELLRRLRDKAYREGISFKELINRVVQRGLEHAEVRRGPVRPLPVFSMGTPRSDVRLEKALAPAFGSKTRKRLTKLERRP